VDESIISTIVNKRDRPTHYTGSTNTGLNQDKLSFTFIEVRELCAEKDQRHAEELAQKEQTFAVLMARNEAMFAHMFTRLEM
jgi:hypothetical protein